MGELHQNYFDPIALLAEDALVPCEFFYAVKSLGRLLDPTSTSADLRKDTRTDLPLWLAKALSSRNMVSMHTPPVYGEWMQRRVDAGAACISLKKTPYFYSVGMQCALILSDESLAAFLRSTFSQRSRDLLSGSLRAPDGAELQKVLNKLNAEENTLYEAGRRGADCQERWWAAGGHTAALLKSNSLAVNGGNGAQLLLASSGGGRRQRLRWTRRMWRWRDSSDDGAFQILSKDQPSAGAVSVKPVCGPSSAGCSCSGCRFGRTGSEGCLRRQWQLSA